MAELEDLRDEVVALRARVAELEAALEACRAESAERWEAIGRLAPAAKRLRAERDELRQKLGRKEAASPGGADLRSTGLSDPDGSD